MPVIRLLLLLLLLVPAALSAQVRIVNAPTLHYRSGEGEREVAANVLTLDVERQRLPSRLTLRVPPTTMTQGEGARCEAGRLVAASPMVEVAAAPETATLDPAAGALLVLTAPGSDRDPAVRETVAVDVAADAAHGTIVLTETAPDSGVFAGALPGSGGSVTCIPPMPRSVVITLSFAGDDGSLATSLSPTIDRAGLVFDAASGALIDGASVTLLTADGEPATVRGDNGVSHYPPTVISGSEVIDAGGHHYPAVRGRYRFPTVVAGRYRLRVTPPAGYAVPTNVAARAVAARDPAGEPFLLDAASTGGDLVLAADGPFATDIPLDRGAAPTLLLTRTLSVRDAMPGDLVEARVQVTNRDGVTSGDLRLRDTLPAELRYRAGSMRGAAEPATDGRTLDAILPSLAPGASVELRYLLAVIPGAAPGEAVVRAQATGASAASNVAAAAVRIRPLLFTDALTIIGQVGEGGCSPSPRGIGGVRLLLEDGSAVVTDRDGLYHLEGVRAGRHVVALDIASLPPGLEPIDCARDTHSAGSATSRFVEGAGGLVQRVDFRLRRAATPAASASPPAPSDDAVAAGNRDWLAGRRPGVAWLFPEADYNPRAPVTRVVVQHAPGQRVALTIAGRPIDPLSFDSTDTDGHGVAVSRWLGIPLAPGENHLAAHVLAADGDVVAMLERVVTVSGPPVRATLDPARSRLVADGSTPPLVAVRVVDDRGRPVRAGTLVPFTVAAPYVAGIAPSADGQFSATVIGDGGLALLRLRPTAQAGAATLRIGFPAGETLRVGEVEAWLVPAAERWTVVGFGAGSLGYDMLAHHARTLPGGERDRRVGDGQLALYARGRIRGSWLLTLAYDSARSADLDRGFLGRIDPNRHYTVYGDGTVQGQDAPTSARLYLRLETRAAHLLFGDIETGSGEARLTRYQRTLTGLQGAYRGGRWRSSGFVARVATIAGHDEIQGNGLTGPYRLRVQGIVPNTDTLRLEVRDHYRSERIVSSTPLARHLDYEIDADAGTLRFREPVASRDLALNPIFVVADYEVASGRAGRLAAGGRVEHRAGRLTIGAAVLHDETRTAAAGLAGLDATLALAPGTTLRAEVASGGDRGFGGGGAAMAEVEHHRGGLDLTAYARQQAPGFGLGQQNLVEAGTRKLGADLHWAAGEIGVTGTGWYRAMLAGPGERVAGQARVDWHRGARTLFAGVEVADDRGLDGGDRSSRLVTLGASQTVAGGALTLSGQTRFAPGGAAASVDFPVRHQLQLGWRLSPTLRLIAGYEISQGAAYRARTAQVGIDAVPWHGARLATTLNDQGIAEAGRRFAQYSIAQSLPLGARWSLDATLDSATTLDGSRIPAAAMVTPFQPVGAAGVLGQDAGDYRAATLGLAYRAGRWSGRGRIEYRRGAADTRSSLTVDALRSLGEGRTLAASGRAYRVVDLAGRTAASTAIDLAIAWRPPASRWSLLDRLTLRHDRGDPVASASGGAALGTGVVLDGSDQLTMRVIDNASLDYRSSLDGRGHGVEASLYYGVKYVRGRYLDETVDGVIDATGIAVRQGLGPHLDIGAAASVQHGWSYRRWGWSGGPALGLSPAGDVWMTLGYNIAGYRDRDLADDRYTRSGAYLTMRFKFDARTVGMAARGLGRGR